MPPDAHFLYLQLGGWIMELWEDLQGLLCLGFGNDHRHQHLTFDVLLSTRRLFMLYRAKLTD